jgi:hypothetical protein
MSHLFVLTRSQLLAAATAITAVAFLTALPPGQADPVKCAQWGFNGRFEASGRNGWWVTFNTGGQTVAGVSATVSFLDGGKVNGNIISGGIQGNQVDFDIQWNDKPNNVWYFTGTVSDDGLVHDGKEGLRNVPPDYFGEVFSDWGSTTPLKCKDAPAPTNTTLTPTPAQRTATVVGDDVKVYNIAHDDVDTGNGIVGAVIGTLQAGQKVEVQTQGSATCKPDDWCKVLSSGLPGGYGFVLGHLVFD